MTQSSIDLAVVGAGPAGLSAGSWAAQSGLHVAVLERANVACPVLAQLHFAQDWVLGEPQSTLAHIAERYGRHAQALPRVSLRLGSEVVGLARQADGRWLLHLAQERAMLARGLILATGLVPVRPAAYFHAEAPQTLDAISLTQQRAQLAPGRVLLLGGGDNALENALYLAQRGHEVTLRTRGSWRGQAHWLDALARTPRVRLQPHHPPPQTLQAESGQLAALDADGNAERFDHIAVLYGYVVEDTPWQWLRAALPGHACAQGARAGQALPELNVWVAGDASGRWHPCVQTALADGVQAARDAVRQLHGQLPAG